MQVVGYRVSPIQGVRILALESRKAQCLGYDEAKVIFQSDLLTKLSREGEKLYTVVGS